METQRYLYTAQVRPRKVDYTYRPLIDVEVGGEENSRCFKALVDSGTDVTMMDQSIASLLGIENGTKAQVSALGAETEGFFANVSLKIDKFETAFSFRVLFVENLSHNFDIILGQEDFFQNFEVIFKKKQNKFYLKIS